MRFFLDQNVDARLGRLLRDRGHQCWTADDSNLANEADPNLTVYAIDKGAVLVTHDREFSSTRRRRILGQHLQVRCAAVNVLTVVEKHLDDVVALFERYDELFIEITPERMQVTHPSEGW